MIKYFIQESLRNSFSIEQMLPFVYLLNYSHTEEKHSLWIICISGSQILDLEKYLHICHNRGRSDAERSKPFSYVCCGYCLPRDVFYHYTRKKKY